MFKASEEKYFKNFQDEYSQKARAFIELLKAERHKAAMTQAQLAEKIGAKKGYISRIENGKTDIQLSTLFRIVEKGLGKKLTLSFS